MDDIVERLRKASALDNDIYRVIHAAAHRILHLEAQVAEYKELLKPTQNPAEGIPS